MKCLLGVDDTDSSSGLCTTYLAFMIASRATERGFQVTGYPRLVRLNPNIPFKTRGNASICLPLETEDLKGTFNSICSIVRAFSDLVGGANTGAVLLHDFRNFPFFKQVYRSALSGVVNKERVARLLRENGVPTFRLGNGMGLVGASASIAFDEMYDHSYELIAYRKREFWGTRRRFDPGSVRRMDQTTFPDTFNNFDYEKGRPLVAPHGPDPVFLGIRGSTPGVVLGAFEILTYREELEGHMIYLSNQCTNAHLEPELRQPIKAYSCGWVEGEVVAVRAGQGGHLYIQLQSQDGRTECAVYRPTGDLQRVARQLISGDRLRISGGVRRPSSRHGKVINVESLTILSLSRDKRRRNPICPDCGARMKSEGAAKGFECMRCSRKLMESADELSRRPRRLRVGLYLPSPRAHRHLTKPLTRYGRETAGEFHPLVEGWIRASQSTAALELARSR